MSDYDPFARGPHPVGVQTASFEDSSRKRTLPVEFWYPATDAHQGQDLSDATRDRFRTMPMLPESIQAAVRGAEQRSGHYPLLIFSHGFGGVRTQTTLSLAHLDAHLKDFADAAAYPSRDLVALLAERGIAVEDRSGS